MNYKNTLNLPKTSFPMRAGLKELEPKMLSFWKELDIYSQMLNAKKTREKFILHDGPPYANGVIHMGHALNKILKDMVVKVKNFENYNCPFICGWDCHGLPVEHQLLKELKLTKHDVDQIKFRKQARSYALKYVDIQKKGFVRLAVFSDWDNPYLTVNTDYEAGVLELLSFLVKEGYVYRGLKPVNWCVKCETALAEAEVEYQDKQSPSIFVLFDVLKSDNLFSREKVSFLVWTTTPWTLISNVAVAVHPDLTYVSTEYNGRTIVLAKDLIPSIEGKLGVSLNIISEFKGSDLLPIVLKHPFLEREARVVLADYVSNADGSGCVHIAPGHGEDDFRVGKEYDLEVRMPLNPKGIFEGEDSFFVKGDTVIQANHKILSVLGEKGALVKQENITHSYPHCWRCKEPIVFRATYQWFVNVDHRQLRDKLLAAINNVNWIPQSGFERMKGMVRLRPDWCLSRQRLWGIPIPAIKCRNCNEIILDSKVIDMAASIAETKGSDSWFTDDLQSFIPRGFSCPNCSSIEFDKESDILDVWFESGASFLSVLQKNDQLRFPADMYLEGSDQHRGWFQVSLIPSVAKESVAPFKNILTHGFVVDGEGKKMSKSMGNVISPQQIIDQYGAEILRLWVAYSDYNEDIRLSEGILRQLTDIYRKVRNTIRFLLGNLCDFNHEEMVDLEDLDPIDAYMLAKSKKTFFEIIGFYDDCQFYKACQKIFDFCNQDLSSFYLDILKDRLYTYSPKSRQRLSSQTVLYYILQELLKVIAPVLSYTAEEAYGYCDLFPKREKSIFLTVFDAEYADFDVSLLSRWERILELREKVLKELENKRESSVIGSSLEASVELCFNKDYDFFFELTPVLKEVFIVSQLLIKQGDFSIKIVKAQGAKCQRCWNWYKELEDKTDILCPRCQNALDEKSGL
ncbi:MAG: isoleucine--tRNA ligase [Candidatus Omnitrophica bacterium]|nr:isoleucine--tRNA ligase [Candidatus Omnitrophota bacterium]